MPVSYKFSGVFIMTNNFFVLLLLIILGACSALPSLDEVLPDSRDEYKKSEALPDLEVPPDLVENTNETTMTVPGEDGTTLTSFNKQRENRGAPATVPASTIVESASKEQWIAVQGSMDQTWNRLQNFFTGKGHELAIDDAELGVLETNWSDSINDGSMTYRNKYKIFAEPGAEPDFIVLYVSNMRQQQKGDNIWSDQTKNIDGERLLVGELNLFLNGPPQKAVVSKSSQAEVTIRKTEISEVDGGKSILGLPEEFILAWRRTEAALERAGFVIDSSDQDSGMYMITYYPSSEEKSKGFLSKLTFWKGDKSEGVRYQISLTGVGDKTELIILNQKGDWESSEDASKIIAMIQNQYDGL